MSTYILKVESYEGDGSLRMQDVNIGSREIPEWEPTEGLYAIVKVEDDRATIVDDGYHNRNEAAAAWPEAK